MIHRAAELVPPSRRYARSFVAALREGFRRGEQDELPERRIRQIEADFARYIDDITDQRGSIRLPTGQIVPKVPFSVHFVNEIPRTGSGKIIRFKLRETLVAPINKAS